MKSIWMLGVAAMTGIGAGPARAQEPAQALPAQPMQGTDAQEGVGDIVVTATRRQAALQTVPIAVTAVTGETLEAIGIKSVNDLGQLVPGLVMGRSTSSAQPTLRGVSLTSGDPGNESPIAIYIDGIYQPEPMGNNFDLVDIERLEVLRGPQGTLYGRNATGGLINVITKDPQHDLSARFSAGIGNFGKRSVSGYVTGGLSSTVAMSMVGQYNKDNGYNRDLVRGGMIGDKNNVTLRSKLLFEPSGPFRLVATAGFFRNEDNAVATPTVLDGNSVGYITNPTPRSTGAYQYTGSGIPFNRQKQYSAGLQMSLDLGAVRLESTTGYQRTSAGAAFDSDGTTSIARDITFGRRSTYVNEELRILSQTDGPFQFIAGLFGIYGKNLNRVKTSPTSPTTLTSRTTTKSVAGFVDGTYELTDRIKLIAGGRITYEKRDFTANTGGAPLFDEAFDDTNFSPRGTLQFQASPHAQFYGTVSRGFKSGVYNAQSTNRQPTAPEMLTDYELGAKLDPASWLRVNLAAFLYKYNDLQVSTNDASGTTRLQNAANAKIKGLELETQFRVTPSFTIRAQGSLLSAKFSSFPNAATTVRRTDGVPGNIATIIDASGNYLYRAPKYTFNVSANYEHDFGDGTFSANVNFYRSARVYYDFSNRRDLSQDPYNKVNAEFAWTTLNDIRIALWGKNLTNEEILINVASSATSDYGIYDEPRSYGATVTFNF